MEEQPTESIIVVQDIINISGEPVEEKTKDTATEEVKATEEETPVVEAAAEEAKVNAPTAAKGKKSKAPKMTKEERKAMI